MLKKHSARLYTSKSGTELPNVSINFRLLPNVSIG